jgi:hypothetical protein
MQIDIIFINKYKSAQATSRYLIIDNKILDIASNFSILIIDAPNYRWKTYFSESVKISEKIRIHS